MDQFGYNRAYGIIRTNTDNRPHASQASGHQSTFWGLFFDHRASVWGGSSKHGKEDGAATQPRTLCIVEWTPFCRAPKSILITHHCCWKPVMVMTGLPSWLSGKEPVCQCRRHRFDPWLKKIPWRSKWQLTLVFLPGEPCGQSLVGYSPRGHGHDLVTEQQQIVMTNLTKEIRNRKECVWWVHKLMHTWLGTWNAKKKKKLSVLTWFSRDRCHHFPHALPLAKRFQMANPSSSPVSLPEWNWNPDS